MYNTMQELVKATYEKYRGVDALSKDDAGHCIYSHEGNGVGCAIGCHFEEYDCLKWDKEGGSAEAPLSMGVRELVDEYPDIVGQVINLSAITVDDLANLQRAHDSADGVNHFRERLLYYLDRGRWYGTLPWS